MTASIRYCTRLEEVVGLHALDMPAFLHKLDSANLCLAAVVGSVNNSEGTLKRHDSAEQAAEHKDSCLHHGFEAQR